jgi:hypothetical protein
MTRVNATRYCTCISGFEVFLNLPFKQLLRIPVKQRFLERALNTGSEKEHCVSDVKKCSNCSN